MALLIFDCDGVLVDSEILHAEVESKLAQDLLGINRDPHTHHDIFTGGGLAPVYAAWEKEIGRPLPADIGQEMQRRKNEAFATHLTAIPHVADALGALASLPCCVASGTPLATLEPALRSTGLYDFFAPNLFTAELVERGKPAPDLFLFAAQKMGAISSDCLVIEDSVNGVRAGVAAGMKVIGFTGGSHCPSGHADKLRSYGAMRVINDMRELPAIV